MNIARTIHAAFHRKCFFLDNDQYRDWRVKMKDLGVRRWLCGA